MGEGRVEMTSNMRSISQKLRHADSRKDKENSRRFAELLARHEVALENMVGEIRAALSESGQGYIRHFERGKLGINDTDDEE